jgi:hypothetical protein
VISDRSPEVAAASTLSASLPPRCAGLKGLTPPPPPGRWGRCFAFALGEAREARACLEAAEAIGYVPSIAPELRDKLDRVIATLVKVVR